MSDDKKNGTKMIWINDAKPIAYTVMSVTISTSQIEPNKYSTPPAIRQRRASKPANTFNPAINAMIMLKGVLASDSVTMVTKASAFNKIVVMVAIAERPVITARL